MGSHELEELRKRKKDQTVKLLEVADVTRQIAEAADRRDELSVQLLLGERERPMRELSEIEDGIRAYLPELPQAQAIRLDALLHGAAPETEAEAALAEQTAQYRRQLESVVALDRQLSVRLGGSRSFYKKFRE
jgi:hypothetical protein